MHSPREKSQQLSPLSRSIVALAVFALASAGITACSSRAADGSQPVASSSATGTPARPVGHIGDTLTLTRADGSTLAVTLDEIINPATVATGDGDPGLTYIATKFTITDPGTVDVEGSVNVNVSVSGSDGQSHPADLKNVKECTNFDSGLFHLAPGDSATGCVVFALPHGVSPTKIKYAPSAGFAEDFGEWTVH